MNPALDHLKSNSLRLSSERMAHNTHVSQLTDKINDAASALAHAEKTFGMDNEKVAPFRATLRKLKQERASIKFPALIDPLPDAESWLKQNPKAEPVEPVTPDIRKGETPLAAYLRRQQVTAGVLATIRRVETAPADPEEAAGPLLEQVDELAAKGAPRIVNGRLAFPKVVAGTTSIDHAVAVLAWIDRPRFADAVKALIVLQDDGPTMTAQERNAELEKRFIELTEALRQEAAVATEAEKAGLRVVRRRDVHPAILLGLKVAPARVYSYLTKGGRS
jgi:hypothetical protein